MMGLLIAIGGIVLIGVGVWVVYRSLHAWKAINDFGGVR